MPFVTITVAKPTPKSGEWEAADVRFLVTESSAITITELREEWLPYLESKASSAPEFEVLRGVKGSKVRSHITYKGESFYSILEPLEVQKLIEAALVSVVASRKLGLI